jgi:hypothetical protein
VRLSNICEDNCPRGTRNYKRARYLFCLRTLLKPSWAVISGVNRRPRQRFVHLIAEGRFPEPDAPKLHVTPCKHQKL